MSSAKHKRSIQEKGVKKSLDQRYRLRNKECILQAIRRDHFLNQLLLTFTMGDAVTLALIFIPLSTPLLNWVKFMKCFGVCCYHSDWAWREEERTWCGKVYLNSQQSASCSFTSEFSRLCPGVLPLQLHFSPCAPFLLLFSNAELSVLHVHHPPFLHRPLGPHCFLCLECFSVPSSYIMLLLHFTFACVIFLSFSLTALWLPHDVMDHIWFNSSFNP